MLMIAPRQKIWRRKQGYGDRIVNADRELKSDYRNEKVKEGLD